MRHLLGSTRTGAAKTNALYVIEGDGEVHHDEVGDRARRFVLEVEPDVG